MAASLINHYGEKYTCLLQVSLHQYIQFRKQHKNYGVLK